MNMTKDQAFARLLELLCEYLKHVRRTAVDFILNDVCDDLPQHVTTQAMTILVQTGLVEVKGDTVIWTGPDVGRLRVMTLDDILDKIAPDEKSDRNHRLDLN
jgi:hypothetical protein